MSDQPPTSPPLPPLPSRPRRSWPVRAFRWVFGRFRNDLFGWEVLRAGRRTGTLAIGRTAFSGLLLAALWLLWNATGKGSGSDVTFTGSGTEIGKKLSEFSSSFAVTFFVVQTLAVLLLTPIFVAGAIFEERETRSGEILLTTQLTRREVYVGKVGARVVQVLLVVLAGMPILFLTQLWGGLAMEMILVNYAATVTATLGAAVVAAAVSAYAETLRAAVLRTYWILFLVDVVFVAASPFLVIFTAAEHWLAGLGMMSMYLPLQLVVVFVGYSTGQRWLRMAMLRQKTRLQGRAGLPPPLPAVHRSRFAPLTDAVDALVWKEMNQGGRVTLRDGLRAFFRLPGGASLDDRVDEMGMVRWLFLSREPGAFVLRMLGALVVALLVTLVLTGGISGNWVAVYVGGLVFGWLVTTVGLSAAGTIARERHKHTLIDLLMLPGPRRELLRAKLIGALSRGVWPFVTLVAVLAVSAASLQLSFAAVGLLVLTATAIAFFGATLGLCLSVQCRNALQSNSIWISVVAGLVIGTLLLAQAQPEFVADASGATFEDVPAWSRIVNPILAWARLSFWHRSSGFAHGIGTDPYRPISISNLLPAMACPILFAGIGIVLWHLAVRRFDREGH